MSRIRTHNNRRRRAAVRQAIKSHPMVFAANYGTKTGRFPSQPEFQDPVHGKSRLRGLINTDIDYGELELRTLAFYESIR